MSVSYLCLEWNAHENAVFDIAWMEGEQMLVSSLPNIVITRLSYTC